jgi:hypothetical protein
LLNTVDRVYIVDGFANWDPEVSLLLQLLFSFIRDVTLVEVLSHPFTTLCSVVSRTVQLRVKVRTDTSRAYHTLSHRTSLTTTLPTKPCFLLLLLLLF